MLHMFFHLTCNLESLGHFTQASTAKSVFLTVLYKCPSTVKLAHPQSVNGIRTMLKPISHLGTTLPLSSPWHSVGASTKMLCPPSPLLSPWSGIEPPSSGTNRQQSSASDTWWNSHWPWDSYLGHFRKESDDLFLSVNHENCNPNPLSESKSDVKHKVPTIMW